MQRKSILIAMLSSLLGATSAHSDPLQDQLFANVLAGAECKQTTNNGLICDYKLKEGLHFSIKDAGGTDTVVGFHHSDINEKFYAVLYFNCIVVVPGNAHPRNYGKEYGAYVSPRTGRAYKSQQECQAAK
jgi:hypothetical protein